MTRERRRTQIQPPGSTSAGDPDRPDRALTDLEKDNQWIDSFIRRLNATITDIGRKY
jgi:hypothetical protein